MAGTAQAGRARRHPCGLNSYQRPALPLRPPAAAGGVNHGESFWQRIVMNRHRCHWSDKRGDKVMSTTEHLTHALTLIRQGYCLGANAKDSKGIACGVLDPDAKSWSLYGASLVPCCG